jgi:anthranilate phosphoribosyltransferase
MTNFHTYIKAVGTGKKHNRNLSEDEMFDATLQMLNQDIFPEQTSAFLLGWRINVESVDEFRGCLRALKKSVQKIEVKDSIEIGYPYDGKVKNPYLFSLIAKVLEPHGVNLIVSGDLLQPAKSGITTKEICTSIDLNKNLHYFDRSDYCPLLSNLSEIRMRLGLRTGLNTVEKLLNPAKSKYALIGTFHKPFVEKYAKIFADQYEKLFIVQGNEGTPEVFSKCKYWVAENGEITEYYINPADFGITYQKSWERITLEESLEAIQNPSSELLKLVKLNAVFYLFMIGRIESIEEGWERI